jgi:hypothetical protein
MGAAPRRHTRYIFATNDSMDVATIASLSPRMAELFFGNGQCVARLCLTVGARTPGISR